VRYFAADRVAGKFSMEELAARLAESGALLGRRMEAADDSEPVRQRLAHIIGIERWGQRRLRVALGEAPVNDEMDAYLPENGLSSAELADEFKLTREDTVDLARKLISAEAAETPVSHNTFGPLATHSWLAYLYNHALTEARLGKLPKVD
ncbi:MAG TPA: hypothetical protein VGE07_16875, partial [Herpetosiphonaceae bacterium]